MVSMSAPRMDTLQIPRDDCANCNCKLALAIYTYRIKSYASVANDLHHILKGVEVEIRNEALCALGKPGRTGLDRVNYFQEKSL